MAQLTSGEKLSLAQQGAYGCTIRCDNPNCGKPILQPIHFTGPKGKGEFCSRECRDAVHGERTKLKRKYKDLQGLGYVPLLGSDVDRIEHQVMEWIICKPHEQNWNFNTIVKMMKGTDRGAIREAINGLLEDKTLYRVGRTMSISKPDEHREAHKEFRREVGKEQRLKERKKKLREKEREKSNGA